MECMADRSQFLRYSSLMKSIPLLFALLLVSLFAAPVHAVDQLFELDAEEWAQPRHGELLIAYPALRGAVGAAGAEGRITIRHGGGEQGMLWAAELRDWLVALGIPSSRLEIAPGGQREGVIELVVTPDSAPIAR